MLFCRIDMELTSLAFRRGYQHVSARGQLHLRAECYREQ